MSAQGEGTTTEPLVAIGAVLAGKYKVERIIAETPLGLVARALVLAAGTKVAIKMLRPSVRDDADAFARFLDEAKNVAALKSDHLVRVRHVIAEPGAAPYIVMEMLDGRDLDAMVHLHGSLSYKVAASLIRQACTGLSVAHAAGILHRDLKPTNLFLARKADGKSIVKVLDLGLMKLKPKSTEQTPRRDVFGSPSYMSPEQVSDDALDERTDVWSLGAVLYELVTGHTAFGAESVAQTLVNISIHHPPPLSTFAEVTPEFEAVVARCLAKDRAERYASVSELATALEPFAEADDPSILLPDRSQSLAPPPPTSDSEKNAETSGPVVIEGVRKSLPPPISMRGTQPPPSVKLSRTFLVAIIFGAAIGGVLAWFLSRG